MINCDLTNFAEVGCSYVGEPTSDYYQRFRDRFLETSGKSDRRKVICFDKIIGETISAMPTAPKSDIPGLVGTLAMARSLLGTIIAKSDKDQAETMLVQAIFDARLCDYAQVTFAATEGLALFYGDIGRLDDARTLHMIAMNAATTLGRTFLSLAQERLARSLSFGEGIDSSVILYECLSHTGVTQVTWLLARTKRIAAIGNIQQLRDEAEQMVQAKSCWHIGQMYAARKTMNQPEQAEEALTFGISTASEIGSVSWEKTFSRELRIIKRGL